MRRVRLALGLLLAAMVVTLGAAQRYESAPTLARERGELVDRVAAATAAADELQAGVAQLRSQVSSAQRQALAAAGSGDDKAAELSALLAGATKVTGPGIKLTITNTKTNEAEAALVRDRDLQRVVNGLWRAGAEAIAVNGERLTSSSAIRAAGEAILVDNRPLVPPYTVLALGAGQHLRAAFSGSVDGRYLKSLEESYAIRASIAVQDRLSLPAAPSCVVRVAKPLPAAGAEDAAGRGKDTP